MKTRKEIKKWLLENAVNENGNLILDELDFSDFDGEIFINYMKVQRNLYQDEQQVQGNLFQDGQTVKGDIFQRNQQVKGSLWQDYQQVNGNLYQAEQTVKGELYQCNQQVQGDFITQTLKDNEEYKIDEYGNTCIVKKTKKITYEELTKILGYDFEIEENK